DKSRLDLHVFFLLSEFSRTCGVSSPVCVPGISAFAAAALVLPGNYPYYLDLIQSLSVGPVLIGLAKFGIAFPVSYHTYNGIRHLCWDLGKGFRLPDVNRSGYVVIGLSVITSIVLALI
uniref:Succinate dehydrogenase cytochrome b560 subunit, mitochondrial n=1 Tax=Oryzias sinensis TaxID=183150 RepID=A0A8C7ZRD5_9TELE